MSPSQHAPLALGNTGEYLTVVGKGRKVVTSAGTAVQFGTGAANVVLVQALYANTGNIMIGDSDVDITDGSENGTELPQGQSITLYTHDLDDWYIDADNNNDGVSYLLLG